MLTVMLATRDRADILGRTLDAMTRLRPPDGGWRLLAVDNGSSDRTPDVLARFSAALPMSVLHCARPGVSAALNAALPHVSGDLAIRADDDVLPAPGWLAAFRDAADRHPEATLFGGAVEADWPSPPPAWLWTDRRALGMLYALTDPPDGPCEPGDVYGPHWAVRAEVFEGGMRLDEGVGPDASKACYAMGNESELFGRLAAAGRRARHVAAARVRHVIRPEQLTEAWILRRAFNCGLGAGPLRRPVRRPAYAAAAGACRRLPPSPLRTRIMLTDRLLAGWRPPPRRSAEVASRRPGSCADDDAGPTTFGTPTERAGRMTAYPDFPNPDLLERIPLDAADILDVGCGAASLALAFGRLNPRARLFGIDDDPEVAALASERCHAFASVDVEQDALPFGDQTFDCIIYGDVLEHMRAPVEVMARQLTALADGGTVLICAPNIEHWSFVLRLLNGTWEYEPQGLFDATHLRWFSMATMRRSLKQLGLVPYDVSPRIFDRERGTAFVDLLAPVLKALNVDPSSYASRATPLQYVWRAKKTVPARLTVAATMLRPVGGVSDLRVLQPQAAMASDPSVLIKISGKIDFASPGRLEPKVAVLHRPILTGAEGLSHLRRLLADEWVVVTEFDDHPDFFPALRGEEQYAFSGVHALQTTTEPLADILRGRNPELQVFPNAIRVLPEVRNFTDPERLTLFFGALNREQDWRPMLPVLDAVAEIAQDRLRFSIVHDQALFDGLATPHKTFTPTCDHPTYMRLLGECEISFMPLAHTAFNRTKSDLKFIEAGACRVAAVASRTVYGESVVDGRTGVLFGDANELYTALLRLISIPASARVLGDAARAYVAEQRMLAYQVAGRIAWYRSLWDRRAELTEALLARVPALAEPAAAPPPPAPTPPLAGGTLSLAGGPALP